MKKVLLVVLCFLLLSQIPFAYRRYQLGRLSDLIEQINRTRSQSDQVPERSDFVEYAGVIHVHSFLGGHSTGTFQEIITAAEANRLKFVIMTEHTTKQFDTSEMTLKGTYNDVLFVNGNEVSSTSGDHLLAIPGAASLNGSDQLSSSEIAANTRARNALSIIAYPEEFNSFENNYDGIEIYNVFTNMKQVNRLVAFFDTLWSHHSYPDLLFANYYQRPTDSLKKWDELLGHGKLVATAGNDSHSNIGISLNDSSGNELIGLKLDPYKTSFHLVRVHVLIPRETPLNASSLVEALRKGHCFIGFDLFGDTSGFKFEASNSSVPRIQGDEIPFQTNTTLKVRVPVPSRLVIFRNGEVFLDESGVNGKELKLSERGIYRAEVYLPQLGKPVGDQPWIISNPIYAR